METRENININSMPRMPRIADDGLLSLICKKKIWAKREKKYIEYRLGETTSAILGILGKRE